MQPQAHVQVLANLLDFHLNPQEALDAPRWQWIKDNVVSIEYGTPENSGGFIQNRTRREMELEHHASVEVNNMRQTGLIAVLQNSN